MKDRVRGYALFGILALGFANWVAWGYLLQGESLRVTFFDVGQGDAIFIETPQGHQILIDGGPIRQLAGEKVAERLPFWDKSLDLVILTHPDADHITGLVGVLEKYDVANVLWTGVEKDTNIFRAWKQVLEKYSKPVYLARAPQKLTWSKNSAYAFMDILYPDDSAIASTKALNDTSIVSRLVFGNHSFLFPGDISKAVEQKLVNQAVDIDADVLKVPHHGSKFSSSESFLEAVSPSLAVIQVGRNNRFGHPTEEVLARFGDIPLLRTDLNGDILIQTNGTSFYESSQRRTHTRYY